MGFLDSYLRQAVQPDVGRHGRLQFDVLRTRLQHAQDYGQGALQVQVPLVLSRRVQNMRQDGRHSHLQVEQTAEKILITKHVVISKKNFKTKVKSIPWPNQSTSSCSLFFLPFFLSFSIFREPIWLHWHPSMGHYYTTMVEERVVFDTQTTTSWSSICSPIDFRLS